MKTPFWIDEQESYNVGDAGFLIRFYHENTGAEHYTLRDTPARTNRSHEDRLHGWCGSYNNVSTHACGAWRVTRTAKNGRMLISKLTGDELAAFLEEMGFPDLTPVAGDSVTI